MGYTEQAERINSDLKQLFGLRDIKDLSNTSKEFLLNTLLQFGQVAKFRCRSNTAYDNFSNECLKDIATAKRVKATDTDDWLTLRAFVETKATDEDLIKSHFEGKINIINLPRFKLVNSVGCSMQGDLSEKDIKDLLGVGWKPEINNEEFITII